MTSLTDLRDALDILLKHVEVIHGMHELETDRDYYWEVSSAEWLDIGKKPPLIVGSFADDANGIRGLLSRPETASAVDLDRLAHLLKLISTKISS